MADAWDPITGRSFAASDVADLLAAADARAAGAAELAAIGEELVAQEHAIRGFITGPLGPDILFVQLLDGAGATIGQFTSRDKHEAASRVCSFLDRTSASGRVTIDCGTWGAIALRHPNGTHVQTSYMDRTYAQTPGMLSYSSESMPEWALGICSMFLFAHTNNEAAKQILAVGEQRRLQQPAPSSDAPPQLIQQPMQPAQSVQQPQPVQQPHAVLTQTVVHETPPTSVAAAVYTEHGSAMCL